jgi:transcription initiation factor TFIIIB Brf1 subunit/transcription initiation factor TFIIB
MWFKEVTKGRIKYFYPKRIHLFEVPGAILVLYHCARRGLVGEAKITKATFEEGSRKYWFDRFLLYPQLVSLRKLRSKEEFKAVPIRGRWWIYYIDERLLREIRRQSGLQKDTREKLEKELELSRKEIEEFITAQTTGFNSQREIEKLKSSGITPAILKKTEEVFSDAKKKRDIRGRSSRLLFYAALYVAYRSAGVLKGLEEIPQKEGYSKKRFASAVELLRWKLQISLPIISAEQWARHYSKLLGLSDKINRTAIELVNHARMNPNLRNRTPRALAAAAIYAACLKTGQQIQRKHIVNTTGISGASLRSLSRMWEEVENVAR